MALLRIGHRAWWSHVPLVGRLAPVERDERHVELDPCLRMKVTARPKGWWDWLTGLNLISGMLAFLKGKFVASGDHLIIDTGKRLVDITGDRLDLSGIRPGDDIEFQLDGGVDPGGDTRIKGKVVLVNDGPDMIAHHRCDPARHPGELSRKIDPADPIGDLIVRRAALFSAFKAGDLTQEQLRERWDASRREALDIITKGDGGYFEKQEQMQQLIEMRIYLPEEIEMQGILLAEFGVKVDPASATLAT